MSVLQCDRNGCENIMCERLILDGSQYICADCYSELLQYKDAWPTEMTALDVRRRIETFMRTEPGSTSLCNVDEVFEALTGSRVEW